MTSVAKFAKSGKRLRTTFEAFKFPSSDTVQFRALITPCLSSCKPVQCNLLNTETGINQEFISYGRRKREAVEEDEMSSHSSSVSGRSETNAPVIEPLNNHYQSVASSNQANYRGNRRTVAPANGEVVNDDLVKDEISNSNHHHHQLNGEEQVYTYTDQRQEQELHSARAVESVTPIDAVIDPKSQVVVVGAIKISDSFDFTAGGNDARDARGNDEQTKLAKSHHATLGDESKVSSLGSRKSFTNSDARAAIGRFNSPSSPPANDCVNIVTVVITCVIFLLGQLIIIFVWYYMYKKIQMYQWLSTTLFPVKPLSKSSRSSDSSIGTLETCSASSESIYHTAGKCFQSNGAVIQSYNSPSPPAPVRVFRARYPFQSSSNFKHSDSSTNVQLPFTCYHQT